MSSAALAVNVTDQHITGFKHEGIAIYERRVPEGTSPMVITTVLNSFIRKHASQD